MLFSSLTFLFTFLPIVILLVMICPRKWHNSILLVASLVFYAWGGVSFSIIILLSILINYFVGLMIDKTAGTKKSKAFLFLGIGVNLLILVLFKYSNFIIENINEVNRLFSLPVIEIGNIALPLGISFFTFQAMSYLIDLYQNRTSVQKRIDKLALYISLFPQLVAGPIVRYRDIANQIEKRKIRLDLFSSGTERFIVGLGKKVLIADMLAPIVDDVFAIQDGGLTTLVAWFGVVLYSFQIYFDFSGYSDMAIGLGRMFGFEICENFNFPYISKSIREFWRRWHISLSAWFRDYVYIPLGGSRKSSERTHLNLLIVFFLTGFWHGASWNFVVWGLFHGFFMVLERNFSSSNQNFVIKTLTHIYAIAIVMIGWVLFRATDFSHAWFYLKSMFGMQQLADFQFNLIPYFDAEITMISVVALLASTPLFKNVDLFFKNGNRIPLIFHSYNLITVIGLFGIFVLCTMKLLTATYTPFIYFRF